ncbi:MAG: ImmA/IrrE family metallo-endopeptidase [Gammaproteobacteria bacterium]|nr:ImmA/IrrE family metallo-endopeptidase [Gammaproteobacteria bacterium]
MICNERQYKITVKQIDNLLDALKKLDVGGEPEWLAAAQANALKSQIADLQSQVIEYDLIKQGKIRYSECTDLSHLPKVLIQARIGKGLSQKDLAEKLGMTMQQIQRYEASNYMGASLARLIEISNILEVSVKEVWGGENESGDSIFVWENDSFIDWKSFPIKEMIQRGWVSPKNEQTPVQLVKEYFTNAAGAQYVTALHRKKFHGGNKPNEYALLAWQARVLDKARQEHENGLVSDFELNDSWLKELVHLSVEDDSPRKAKEYLAAKGIALVVEKHLQGTYLDGAAMLLETSNPVVALTLRHDRLDNFWFVLFHELGHVFRHLFNSLSMDFFDETNDESGSEDDIEKEADLFALNALIPESDWDDCLSKFSMTKEAVEIDAKSLGVHPSIVAGRIRKERNNYTLLNDSIGRGEVRILFDE